MKGSSCETGAKYYGKQEENHGILVTKMARGGT